MKLNPEQISRMVWSVFKDQVGIDGYHLPEAMQNVTDIIMGDAKDGVGHVFIRFTNAGTTRFAHLQIGDKLASNVIDVYDSIGFDEDGNPEFGKLLHKSVFEYHEIRNAWMLVFGNRK